MIFDFHMESEGKSFFHNRSGPGIANGFSREADKNSSLVLAWAKQGQLFPTFSKQIFVSWLKKHGTFIYRVCEKCNMIFINVRKMSERYSNKKWYWSYIIAIPF